MEKLNFNELEDPRKLAEALGCEMVELANAIRVSGIPCEALQRMERCLLLSGLAAGTILKLVKESMNEENLLPPGAGSPMLRLAADRLELSALRDRFAMAALQGLLADHTMDPTASQSAKYAYEFADAMIEARKR